jgi:hypothetical protein
VKKIIIPFTFLFLVSCTPPTSSNTWNEFFSLTNETVTSLQVTSELDRVDVTEVVEITSEGQQTLLGYEASVKGNHASVRIRFRLGVSPTSITHFDVLSHQEHAGFGVVLIQALSSSIVGLEPSLSALELALQTTAVPSTALTETYEGMMPAIDAMLLHARAQFE